MARADDPDSDLRLRGGARLRLRGGARPGRHPVDAGRGRDRLRAVEFVFAAVADRDRRPHPRAARLPLHRGGAARPQQRHRGGGAHQRRRSAAGRGRRQPADGAARHPVRRRAGVLPGLRDLRPAAGARRSAGHPGARHLPLQADQQARRAVLSAHGGGGRHHRGDHGAAHLHAAAIAAAGAALRLGARQGTARRAAQARHLALAGLHRHRAVVRRHRGDSAVRHHAALVRRNLGARRRALRGAHARALPRAVRVPEPDPRHDQHARHRRDRRRRRHHRLYGDRAVDPPLEFAVDARGRLSRDGAARHAGTGRRPGAAVGVPVRQAADAAARDTDFGLARLHHRLAGLRHAARIRDAAAGRARARRGGAHHGGERPAGEARRHRAADPLRHAGELAARSS